MNLANTTTSSRTQGAHHADIRDESFPETQQAPLPGPFTKHRVIHFRRRLQALYALDPEGTHDWIVSRSRELKRDYPEVKYCLFYHELIGSTPPQRLFQLDLPEGIIERLLTHECWQAVHRVFGIRKKDATLEHGAN